MNRARLFPLRDLRLNRGMFPDPRHRPVYIGSEIYRRSSYGPKHPLAVPRVSTCTDLIRAMGWLDESVFVNAPLATDAQLLRFHQPDYLAALKRAETSQSVSPEDRARFRIGADGNPVFREIFSRPATSAGGVMLAARLTAAGGIVHCPGGGTHHGRRDRASGFCYLNDPVLGILTWLDQGFDNIVYLDIDAHHGDGVQDAFHDDHRVFTISIHEAGRWPVRLAPLTTAPAAPRATSRCRKGSTTANFAGCCTKRCFHSFMPGGRRRSCCRPEPTRWKRIRWRSSRYPTTRTGWSPQRS